MLADVRTDAAWFLLLFVCACRSRPTEHGADTSAPAPTPQPDAPVAPLADVARPPPNSAPLAVERAPFDPAHAAPRPGQPGFALENAAALDSRRVLAIGNGHLYRLQRDRWILEALDGAEARDLVTGRNYFWILARGTAAARGRVLLLRTPNGVDLSTTASPLIDADVEPRSLVALSDSEFLVGGAHPSLFRWSGTTVAPLAPSLAPLISLRLLRDDSIIARHDSEHVSIVRMSNVTHMTVGDYLDTVVDRNGTSYLVHTHGQFVRDRPGREYSVATTAAPFEPRIAVALPGERLIVVGASGPYAEWRHNAWQVLAGDFPRDPIAVLPTDPISIVGRDGQITAADPAGARVLVAAAR